MNKLDVMALINPQMKAVLEREDSLAGDTNDTSVGFEVMRRNYIEGRRYWTAGGPEMVAKIDEAIEGPHGFVPVRFYYPNTESLEASKGNNPALPAIVYVHGGGFALGNLDTHDRICRVLADKVDLPVCAIDYRLAPEAKFPTQVEEIAAVAEYLHAHGSEYGIDGDRLGFAGDSGGAHLSLAATLYLRQEKGDASFVKSLLLFYGWFGLSDSSSMRLLGGPWDGLAEDDWAFYLSLYLNDPTEAKTNPYVNLFLNDMTHDMPACYIAAAQYDPLRDDSATLAAICEQYGIPYDYEVFRGTIHAFLHYTSLLDDANDALEHGASFFREQLGLPFVRR